MPSASSAKLVKNVDYTVGLREMTPCRHPWLCLTNLQRLIH